MPGRGIARLRRLACGGQPENVGDAVSGIVAGKRALVVGVANKRSIAWAIARRLDEEGARVALTFQGDRVEKDVRKLADELTNGPVPVLPLDVTDDAQLDAAVAGTLHRFKVKSAGGAAPLEGLLRDVVNHVEVNNQGAYHSAESDRVVVAVVDEAPFQLELESPPVPIVKIGTLQL